MAQLGPTTVYGDINVTGNITADKLVGNTSNLSGTTGTVRIDSIIGGYNYCVALTLDGKIITWGNFSSYNLPTGGVDMDIPNYAEVAINYTAPVKQYEVFGRSAYVLLEDGNLWAWGNNNQGQMGTNNFTSMYTPKVILTGVKRIIKNSTMTNNLMKSGNGGVGVDHVSMFVEMLDGSWKCWGDNRYGKLADGTGTQNTTPRNVTPSPSGGSIKNIWVIGQYYGRVFMTDSNGHLYGAGCGAYGSLGIGAAVDTNNSWKRVTIPFSTSEIKLLVGSDGYNGTSPTAATSSSVILTTTGLVYFCGDNAYGTAGDGTTNDALSFKKVPVPVVDDIRFGPLGGIYAMPAGETKSFYYAWGFNDRGQLGVGDGTAASPTVKRVDLNYKDIITSADAEKYCYESQTYFQGATDGEFFATGRGGYGVLLQPGATDAEVTTPKQCTFYEKGIKTLTIVNSGDGNASS